MKYYVKEIGYRIVAVILAITISMLAENLCKTVMNKDTVKKEQRELIEKIVVRGNDEKQIIGVYEELHSGTTETGTLFVFPDKTWILITRGCFGGSLQDKGDWFYNNGRLVLSSDRALKFTTSENIVYWLTNVSSQRLLFDNKAYAAYLDGKIKTPNLEQAVLKYSFEKIDFDFSSYKDIKQKYLSWLDE